MTTPCPCQSTLPYAECCGRFHRGTAVAPTAERLMRSRYAAFAVGDATYLLDTWHVSTRPSTVDLDPGLRWTDLQIVGRTRGGLLDSEGTVEFTAAYLEGGADGTPVTSGTHHEFSRFVREQGRWFYFDAT